VTASGRGASGAAGLPIIPHYSAELSAVEQAKLADLAARITAEEPNLAAVPPFDPLLGVGLVPGPSLLVEDHGGIQLAHESGADLVYSYRPLVLAGDGDMLAVYGARNPAFETYCREFLCLGHVRAMSPAAADPRWPPARACAEDGAFVGRLAEAARSGGGLNVVPYMATGDVWRLAGEIAQRAQVPVRVAAPPPRLARQVNDKVWFARRAAEALGQDAVPPSMPVYGIAALAGYVRRLGRQSESVALKLTHSAASRGNLVLDVPEIAGLSPLALGEHLKGLMHRSGWPEEFPIQVTAWEGPLLGSPSVQLWIPPQGEGAPIIEGVFDQIVSGRLARFTGGMSSELPDPLRQRIAAEAMQLGTLFQLLGYFGRCGFDTVLVGRTTAEARLLWVECNGRWTGMSIPMTLANRLTGDWAAGGFMVISRRPHGLLPRNTQEFLDRYADALYRPGVSSAGAVLLVPGRLEAGRGIDLLILGTSAADARERGEAILGRLTG
jgi:hypothetical protein